MWVRIANIVCGSMLLVSNMSVCLCVCVHGSEILSTVLVDEVVAPSEKKLIRYTQGTHIHSFTLYVGNQDIHIVFTCTSIYI